MQTRSFLTSFLIYLAYFFPTKPYVNTFISIFIFNRYWRPIFPLYIRYRISHLDEKLTEPISFSQFSTIWNTLFPSAPHNSPFCFHLFVFYHTWITFTLCYLIRPNVNSLILNYFLTPSLAYSALLLLISEAMAVFSHEIIPIHW